MYIRITNLGVGGRPQDELHALPPIVAANGADVALQRGRPLLRNCNQHARWELEHVANACEVLRNMFGTSFRRLVSRICLDFAQ